MVHAPSGPRTLAIVGPYGCGKSTLFEALLNAAGAPLRRGADRGGTELRIAHCSFMDEPWALIDCPGSVEFAHSAQAAMAVADIAVVVCEADPARAPTVAPVLRVLDGYGVPYLIFVNRIDTLSGHVRDTYAALQTYTKRKLVLRQVPIRDDQGIIVGYVDVVSERAYRYRKGSPSDRVPVPETLTEREREVRAGLVEVLADHDDGLLEKVVEDITPTPGEIYHRLRQDEAEGAVAGVLLGAADRSWGVNRLWKALRHDAPAASEIAMHRGVEPSEAPLVQVFRTNNGGQGGKVSWARVWRGKLKDGATLNAVRVGGIWRAPGGEPAKIAEATAGEIVALGRLEGIPTGAVLGDPGTAVTVFPEPPPPVYAMAINTADRKDDVRLSGAMQKLAEEDPSLTIRQDPETGETVLSGQGEMHLRSVMERLAGTYGVPVTPRRPRVPFRETIRKPVHQQGRLKRQTGGHGQFADVKLEISPRASGEGFLFVDKIVGGAVPRNFIPAVGEAAKEAVRKGVFGYPVVDIEVKLVDGGFHSVDSSDMAFRTATKMAISEALPKADPVLLEPVDHVVISVPKDYTAAAQRILSGRRGQILGYGDREGWDGWDDVEAQVPEVELHDLIIELRSATMGLGTYRRRFDHLAEAHGRVVQAATAATTTET
jgi:elongation factor G